MNVLDFIVCAFFLTILVTMFIIILVLACKGSRNRKLFISHLNEHDKNVVLEYMHITAFTKIE